MALPPKVCPECMAEYVHAVTQCGDCNVPLVLADQLAERPQEEMPPASELVLVRAATFGWIEALALRLQEEGIDGRVEFMEEQDGKSPRSTSAPTCGLFVRPESAQRAKELDGAFMRDQIPDLPEASLEGEAEGEGEGCPACGAAAGPEASECPDCGLTFAVVEED